MIDDKISIVTISIDGNDVECVLLSIFTAGDNTYAALMDIRDIKRGNDIALIYRYKEIDTDPFISLEDIDEDEEYDYAVYEFAAKFDDQQCSDIIDHYKNITTNADK